MTQALSVSFKLDLCLHNSALVRNTIILFGSDTVMCLHTSVCPRAGWLQDGSLRPHLQWGQALHVQSPLLPGPGILYAYSPGGPGQVSAVHHHQASASGPGGPTCILDDEHGASGKLQEEVHIRSNCPTKNAQEVWERDEKELTESHRSEPERDRQREIVTLWPPPVGAKIRLIAGRM